MHPAFCTYKASWSICRFSIYHLLLMNFLYKAHLKHRLKPQDRILDWQPLTMKENNQQQTLAMNDWMGSLKELYNQFSAKEKDRFLNCQTSQQQLPVQSRRPSPRQERHFVRASLVLITPTFLSLPTSLEGSSHRFSPRRNTRCWDTSTSVSPSSFTTFCCVSNISVTEVTAVPLVPSWETANFRKIGRMLQEQKDTN